MNGLNKAIDKKNERSLQELLGDAIKYLNGCNVDVVKNDYGRSGYKVDIYKELEGYDQTTHQKARQPIFNFNFNYQNGSGYNGGLESMIARAVGGAVGYSLKDTIVQAIKEAKNG